MKKLFLFMLLAGFVLCAPGISMAYTITYTATDNGGGNYTLDYTVINDTSGPDIGWFSIYYGQDMSLTDPTIPGPGLNFANWDQFSGFSPDDWGTGPEPQPTDWFSYSFEYSSIDLPAQFNSDAELASAGIAYGSSLGGFTVSFDWTGIGSYDGLYFEVGPIGGWDPMGTGYTQAAGIPSIPEPATLLLLGTGLVGLGFFKRKRSRNQVS